MIFEAPLPLVVSAGIKYNIKNVLLLNTSMGYRPHAQRMITGLGAELSLGQSTTLRAGYLVPLQATDASSAAKMLSNFGFGLGWKFPSRRLKLDYSMAPGNSDLGMTHRFTVQLGWGKKDNHSRNLRDAGLDDDGYTTPFFQAL